MRRGGAAAARWSPAKPRATCWPACCCGGLTRALAGAAGRAASAGRRWRRRASTPGGRTTSWRCAATSRCCATTASSPRIRSQLAERLLRETPDAVHRRRRARLQPRPRDAAEARAGIKTIHFVCPSIWAWRGERVAEDRAQRPTTCCACSRSSRRSAAAHGIAATYVGHPLADAIPLEVPRAASRAALGLAERRHRGRRCCPAAGAPRSQYIAPRLLAAAALMQRERAGPALRAAGGAGAARAGRAAAARSTPPACRSQLLDGRSHEALAACDVTLIASGTATLEAALFKRPMVIAYRMHCAELADDEAHELPALGRPAQHPAARLRRARADPGRRHARARWRMRRWPGSTTPPRCARAASSASPTLHLAAAPRHRAAGHRCDREDPWRAEQLGLELSTRPA